MVEPDVSARGAAPCVTQRARLIVGIAIGVVVACVAFFGVQGWQDALAEVQLRQRTQGFTTAIRLRLGFDVTQLKRMRELFEKLPEVSQRRFLARAPIVIESDAGMTAVAWIPEVPAEVVDSWLLEMRKAHGAQFAIRTYEGAPRANGEPALPVTLLSSGDEPLLRPGLDLGSNPLWAAAVKRAFRTGGAVLSDVSDIRGDARTARAALVLLPVSRVASGAPYSRGIVASVYEIDPAFAEVTSGLGAAGLSLEVSDSGPLSAAPSADPVPIYRAGEPRADGITETYPLEVLGRRWSLEFRATRASLLGYQPYPEWLAALAVLLLTAFLLMLEYRRFARELRIGRLAERRQGELQRARSQYETIVNFMGQGVVLLDADGHLVSTNPSTRHILGMSCETFLSGVFEAGWELRTRDGDPILPDGLPTARALRSGRTVRETVALRGPDGHVTWVHIHARPLSPHTGFALVATFEDNTHAIELQQQLRQAQKMEAIGQLTGGIAHDFNNILAGILGYTTLAIRRSDSSDSNLHRYLLEVERAGERARDLVRQMLVFSRTDAGRPERLQLRPAIEEVVAMLRATLPASIELRVSVIDQDILFDPVQLHQTLLNLCINARDALHHGGAIDIAVEVVDLRNARCASCGAALSGRHLSISVEDNGAGMSAEQAARIFDPFYTTKETGTGMGLSTVHGIIHEHQGHIVLESTEGEGTRFALMFAGVGADALPGPADAEPGPVSSGGRFVLVVDDDATITRFLKELLELNGYSVGAAATGADAQALMYDSNVSIDLAILDYRLPDCTGLELAQELKAVDPSLPIILCTGFGGEVTREQANAAGVGTYMTKPVDIHRLLSAVGRSLDVRDSSERVAAESG